MNNGLLLRCLRVIRLYIQLQLLEFLMSMVFWFPPCRAYIECRKKSEKKQRSRMKIVVLPLVRYLPGHTIPQDECTLLHV